MSDNEDVLVRAAEFLAGKKLKSSETQQLIRDLVERDERHRTLLSEMRGPKLIAGGEREPVPHIECHRLMTGAIYINAQTALSRAQARGLADQLLTLADDNS